MRVDTRKVIELDGPHPRRRRLSFAWAGYALVIALLLGTLAAAMATPLPY
jgi:hypothetical protein